MLNRKISKLKLDLKSKGRSRFILLHKYILTGIPVLSIFALVGIATFSIINLDTNEVYAETYTASDTSGNSSISLTIGGAGETEQVEAGRGSTTYRSHTIRIKADVIEDYGLTISGSANLTAPSGGNTIGGANNTTGTNMANNTWGYGWGDTSTSDADLIYRTLNTAGTDLLTVNNANDKPALVDRAIDFTKKLVFAVKFSDDAIPGRYYANVTLSLTATPAVLTKYSITYNANGGSNAPATQTAESYDKSYSFTAAAKGSMARSGYTFLGWSTSNTATSVQYAAEATVSLTQNDPTKTLYAVWQQNSYNYKVTFNCNGGTGCPSNLNTTSTATSYSYTIPSTEPTKSGYVFLGYNTSSSATTANTAYTPSKTITLTSSSPALTLYAVWKVITPFPSSLTTMQGMTATICKNASVGATATLTDTRDNNTYTIAKLADNKCWMTQNLRIVNKPISSTSSDVSSSFTIPASNISGFSSATTANAYYNNNTNFGAYYTWCAATAGTCSSATDNNTNASASICPKGWKLPLGGTNGDFSTLYNIYNAQSSTWGSSTSGFWLGAASLTSGGSFFYAAGSVRSSELKEANNSGFYWSRTSAGSGTAYHLSFYKTSSGVVIMPNDDYTRSIGASIRCVAYSS